MMKRIGQLLTACFFGFIALLIDFPALAQDSEQGGGGVFDGIGDAVGNAAQSESLIEAMETLAENVSLTGPFGAFIAALAFVMGLIFVVSALLKFAKVSSGPQQGASFGNALTTLIVGLVLMQIVFFLGVGQNTLGVNPDSQLSYDGSASNFADAFNLPFWIQIATTILGAVGIISFMRGLILIKDSTEQKNQDASPGKAITHLIAGILLLNFQWTICMLAGTVGKDICA